MKLSKAISIFSILGMIYLFGCGGENSIKKSQEIVNTSKIATQTRSIKSLVKVQVESNQVAQDIANLYESIDICSDTKCFRTPIIKNPTDNIIANIVVNDFKESLKYVSYKKYNHSAYDSYFFNLPKKTKLLGGSPYKLFLETQNLKNTLKLKPVLLTIFSPIDKSYLYTNKQGFQKTIDNNFSINIEKDTFNQPLSINISSKKDGLFTKYYIGLAEDNITIQKPIKYTLAFGDTNLTKNKIK